MKRDLATVGGDLRAGKGPRLLLLFGDDLQVQNACKGLVDLLVSEAQRGLNFERLDGRTTDWDQIEASLMTPPFFPGKKVLWVENVPYFLSAEQKGELGDKVLQLWSDNRRDEASKLLIDLLLIEGWTQDRWERAGRDSPKPLLELLKPDGSETHAAVEQLWSYCKIQGIVLDARKTPQKHQLLELLERGIPEWDILLLSALQVDRRTRLYKRCEELGAVLYLGLERDRYGKVTRDSLLEFISRDLTTAGKTLEPQARDLILSRAGDDLGAVHHELEKLVLFVGERPTIRARDVEMIFADQNNGWIFDLIRALGERDAVTALAQLTRLMAHGEHPLRLLGTIAAEVRRLLSARQFIDGELRGVWRGGMSFAQFQQSILNQGAPLLSKSPYGDYLCFQRAHRFSLTELRYYMEKIFAADLSLKSSGSRPGLVMEKLIFDMCLSPRRNHEAPSFRAGI